MSILNFILRDSYAGRAWVLTFIVWAPYGSVWCGTLITGVTVPATLISKLFASILFVSLVILSTISFIPSGRFKTKINLSGFFNSAFSVWKTS